MARLTPAAGRRRRCTLVLLAVLGSAVFARGVVARAAGTTLSDADIKTLAELSMQWAIDGGIADFKLSKEPAKLIVSRNNLPKNIELKLPERTVLIMSPLRIQARADVHGDYLYFELGPFTRKGKHAEVPVALRWAVGVNSTTQYLSGGGATLDFEKKKGKWHLQPVTHRWMS